MSNDNPELGKDWPDMIPVKLPILPPDLQAHVPTPEEIQAMRAGYALEMAQRDAGIERPIHRRYRSLGLRIAAFLAAVALALIAYTLAAYLSPHHV